METGLVAGHQNSTRIGESLVTFVKTLLLSNVSSLAPRRCSSNLQIMIFQIHYTEWQFGQSL